MCSPTRSSLMTGRYHYRTGIVDTPFGRSMMYPEEVTIALVLRNAGYRTGIFGKWHLGDNYPLRAMDHGFEESVVLGGGGLTQGGDWPGNTYFSPVLRHNGRPGKYDGYCTDIFARECMRFMEESRAQPFFAYLAFNAPHGPLQVDEAYAAPFRAMGLGDNTAKLYGMVSNLDENVGRVLKKLADLELEQDTIVIFVSDNGPGFRRFNAGMRGYKGSQFEGGLRVPFFLRWPGKFQGKSEIDRLAAHIDIFPTLLEACGVDTPANVRIDGRSLAPLLRGEVSNWRDREICFQWHPGETPELYRNCALRNQVYKLVNGRALYDLSKDPEEQTNVAAGNPEIVQRMRLHYEDWFREMNSEHGFAPPRIVIGTRFENPSLLTRQDFRGPNVGWDPDAFGYWEIEVAQSGTYQIELQTFPVEDNGTVHFRLNGVTAEQDMAKGSEEYRFWNVWLPKGSGRMEAFVLAGYKKFGARYVQLERS